MKSKRITSFAKDRSRPETSEPSVSVHLQNVPLAFSLSSYVIYVILKHTLEMLGMG